MHTPGPEQNFTNSIRGLHQCMHQEHEQEQPENGNSEEFVVEPWHHLKAAPLPSLSRLTLLNPCNHSILQFYPIPGTGPRHYSHGRSVLTKKVPACYRQANASELRAFTPCTGKELVIGGDRWWCWLLLSGRVSQSIWFQPILVPSVFRAVVKGLSSTCLETSPLALGCYLGRSSTGMCPFSSDHGDTDIPTRGSYIVDIGCSRPLLSAYESLLIKHHQVNHLFFIFRNNSQALALTTINHIALPSWWSHTPRIALCVRIVEHMALGAWVIRGWWRLITWSFKLAGCLISRYR